MTEKTAIENLEVIRLFNSKFMNINETIDKAMSALVLQSNINKHDQEVRAKAIDDFVEKINHIGYVPVCVDCITKHQIIEMAEQLKE